MKAFDINGNEILPGDKVLYVGKSYNDNTFIGLPSTGDVLTVLEITDDGWFSTVEVRSRATTYHYQFISICFEVVGAEISDDTEFF